MLEALSFTSEEALAENMIDFIASDVDDLLQQVHGLETPLRPPGGPRVTLETQGITVQTMELSLVERLLRFLANPNISFLLLSLGGLGLFVELLNPGLILPGVAGIIMLVLAWVVLGKSARELGRSHSHPACLRARPAGILRLGLWRLGGRRNRLPSVGRTVALFPHRGPFPNGAAIHLR